MNCILSLCQEKRVASPFLPPPIQLLAVPAFAEDKVLAQDAPFLPQEKKLSTHAQSASSGNLELGFVAEMEQCASSRSEHRPL